MDVGARQEFWQAMRADAALGRTIVFATHYLAEADEFAERTVLMNHGRIVHDAADHRRARGLRRAHPHLPAPGPRASAPTGIDAGVAGTASQPRSRPSASPTSRSRPPAWRPPSSP